MHAKRLRYATTPDGRLILLSDLPPAHTTRWVISRKMIVVAAVRSGLISMEEVCHRYKMTHEEYLSWSQAIDKYGPVGLRATRVKQYRGS